MIVDAVVNCAWAAEKRVKNVLFLERSVIASTAQLKRGAGCFVKANVQKEFGHWKSSGSEGQLCPEADAGSASGKAGVVRTAIALDRKVLATVETNDRGNEMG